MVMEKLSNKLWTNNKFDSLRAASRKNTEDYVYGKSCLDLNVKQELHDRRGKDWKLMIDPVIKGKTHTKVTRYGGMLDGPNEMPVPIKDPRDKLTPIRRTKEIELKVPKFKFDKWSVGSPPMKSIFIYGLNDNVNQEFLTNLLQPLGNIDQLKVYYHPKSRKHLGIAFVSFSTPSSTKEVVAKYHGTSIMGNIVNMKPDPLCQITKKVLDQLIKSPVANIPEIIQSVQLKSHHKTVAYAFRHNEHSLNYYTARGKVRRPSDSVRPAELHHQEHKSHVKEVKDEPPPTPQYVPSALMLEQVSPKAETPPHQVAAPEEFSQPDLELPDIAIKREREEDEGYDTKYKSLKHEFGSPPERVDDMIREARLYEMDKERKKDHAARKFEEWRIHTEMQMRAEKTTRYVKEHCGGSSRSSASSDKYASDKYAKDYHHLEREHYYKYYDKYYREKDHREKDHRYHDEKYWSKYDKYGKYYDYHRYGSEYKRSSSSKDAYEKIHKFHKSSMDYERYEPQYHDRRSSGVGSSSKSEYRDSAFPRSPSELEHHKFLELREQSRSRSRPREVPHLPERVSKRKRSKSPNYHQAPVVEPKKTPPKLKTSGSATSHDTGYNSISPLPVSPVVPKPEPPAQPTKSDLSNPFGCARAVPRKDISRLKVIGLRSDANTGSLSSSPMSLDEDSEAEMRVEDISPNNTPQYDIDHVTKDPEAQDLPPVLAPTIALLPLPPATMVPVQYQTGQWMHSTYPDMYQYGYDYGTQEEAAVTLARRETEEKMAAKQREMELIRVRMERSISLLLNELDNVLHRDIKIKLNEKVAFAQLEVIWDQEQDKKKKEEEELLAKKREEQALSNKDEETNQVPDMPSLSEMRSMSDAKSDSHIRQSHIKQTNLSFKVPKLNRFSGLKQQLGMRAQVIIKKLPLPAKLIESLSEEEPNEEDLVCKRRQAGSRYNTIYSSSSSSSESEEEEEEIEEKVEKRVTIVEEIVIPDKYSSRSEEEEELIMEQLFREDMSEEDKVFFKSMYDRLNKESDPLLDGVTWLTPPEIPSTQRRRHVSSDVKHRTGCARTEGFYKVSSQEKMVIKLSNLNKAGMDVPIVPSPMKKGKRSDGKTAARTTRAYQRRQATHYFDVSDVQYLQLTTRRKQVKFQRSDIHDWGLFALESISADEMVIEYVGEVVREIIANLREKVYTQQGIGSSYLFRIDQSSYIVDATHRGSISRFINHNCDPNCYARVISVGTKKKIVIYSKRDIASNEEITYDYKFAIEADENKIPCLCRAGACRGFLN